MLPTPVNGHLLVADVAFPFQASPLIDIETSDGFSKYHWAVVLDVSEGSKYQKGDLVYSRKQTGDMILVDDHTEMELLHESQLKGLIRGYENPKLINIGAKEISASLARVVAHNDQMKEQKRAAQAGLVTG
jgi:hypothetical protein